MAVPPAEPGATADLTSEAGSTRKLRLDEMLAERDRAPLPPAPVLTLQPVPVDAAPVGAGRRGAMKRLAEVEALARNNLRAAEEAQRVVQEERALLEEEAQARTAAERTASALRRELERLRSTEEQRAAQAQFAATHQAQTELASEMERVHNEHARVVDELDRMRGTLFDHDSLLDEYSQRLHDEQQAQAKARADLVRAEEAQREAERKLEIALETARRRAEDDHGRLVRVEEQLRDVTIERDKASTELVAITTGDGELSRLRAEAAATHEDITRLLADLDVQAARADKAEAALATATEALTHAERTALEKTEALDLAGIALETTRSELADCNELLDAERTASQTKVADLTAQLATTTRTAESATERIADLEARLDAAVAARDDAATHAADYSEQLEHATADAEQLRQHATTIGDELASTHAALEQRELERDDVKRQLEDSRLQLERAHRQLDEAERRLALPPVVPAAAGAIQAVDGLDAPGALDSARPIDPEPAIDPVRAIDVQPIDAPTDESSAPVVENPEQSPFDAAIASAFGSLTDAKPVEPEKAPAEASNGKTPPMEFRTVEPKGKRKRKGGGPIVDAEAALVRETAPVDPDPVEVATNGDSVVADAPAEGAEREPAEVPAWRRTAMAELTALAADSDDLTPRRRR